MSENTHAAERRADYVRALTDELEQCRHAGKADRVKAIEAELDRVGEKPAGRQAQPSQTAATKRAAKKA
jgi:hypothetical protein